MKAVEEVLVPRYFLIGGTNTPNAIPIPSPNNRGMISRLFYNKALLTKFNNILVFGMLDVPCNLELREMRLETS